MAARFGRGGPSRDNERVFHARSGVNPIADGRIVPLRPSRRFARSPQGMKPGVDIVAIDHVQLSMLGGRAAEADARAFYAGILGLREVPKPAALAGRGGVWFAGDGVAVHLGVESTFAPAAKAHPALTVRDLDHARAVLVDAGVAIEEDDSGLQVARCYIRDPFGNRIELVDQRDAGFSERI